MSSAFLSQFKRVHILTIALASAVSGVGGAVLGAKVALDKYGEQLRTATDEALVAEIEKTKEFYKTLYKKEDLATPEQALLSLHKVTPPNVEEAAEALLQYAGGRNPELDRQLVEVSHNVFTDAQLATQPFDYETELLHRDPDRPYLITEDEFLEAAPGYEQSHMTYYTGDAVLSNDAGDEMVPNTDEVVGDHNLIRFGQGSNDENIVYIRNVAMELDVEIARSPGKYAIDVLGLGPDDDDGEELKHSHRRPPRKFRDSDE